MAYGWPRFLWCLGLNVDRGLTRGCRFVNKSAGGSVDFPALINLGTLWIYAVISIFMSAIMPVITISDSQLSTRSRVTAFLRDHQILAIGLSQEVISKAIEMS